MTEFLDLFKQKKALIGMLHLGLKDLETTKREIDIYIENGFDAVLAEDYFSASYNRAIGDIETILAYLQQFKNDVIYGVNCLRNPFLGLTMARDYGAKFVQFDSVSGHLEYLEDRNFGISLSKTSQETNAMVIGGVRFKYQPHLSGRTLEEDLLIGMQRCQGIVVTGAGTAMETPLDKTKEFRRIIKDFPLIIGAGLNLDNCLESMEIADAAIVGSSIKDNGQATGDVDSALVKRLVNKIDTIR